MVSFPCRRRTFKNFYFRDSWAAFVDKTHYLLVRFEPEEISIYTENPGSAHWNPVKARVIEVEGGKEVWERTEI